MAARIGIAFLAVSLLVTAPWARAADQGEPFIAPAVVEQAGLALHLADVLGLPRTDMGDADQAMRALAAVGIEPAGGWRGDMPVTPQILAELRHAVANAAAAGRLALDPAAAVAAFTRLVADLRLPLPYEPVPAYAGPPPAYGSGYCDRAALDYYYGAVGPPYYTYCPPPPSYYYLYAWVPSRFYWSGYYFSGYFMLRDVHVVPRFKHRAPPRFSDGVLGGHRHFVPRHALPDERKTFRDRHAGRPPERARTLPPAPRVTPRAPERPRFSDGVLGGRSGAPTTVTGPRPPLAQQRPAPPAGPAPRADARASPTPRANVTRPSVPPPSQGSGRGWRDVVPGRR